MRDLTWTLGESTINTASTATVGRIFIGTVGSGATTSSNTHLFREIPLASQTPSSTVSMVPIIIPLNLILPSGYFILVTNHAAPVANTHWKAIVTAGQY